MGFVDAIMSALFVMLIVFVVLIVLWVLIKLFSVLIRFVEASRGIDQDTDAKNKI